MRNQSSGHIISISSVSGVEALPGLGCYASSKHALEALHESEGPILIKQGIRFSLIEPGPVKTEILSKSCRGDRQIVNHEKSLYGQFLTSFMNDFEQMINNAPTTPVVIANLVIDVLKSDKLDIVRYQPDEFSLNHVQSIKKDPTGAEAFRFKSSLVDQHTKTRESQAL